MLCSSYSYVVFKKFRQLPYVFLNIQDQFLQYMDNSENWLQNASFQETAVSIIW